MDIKSYKNYVFMALKETHRYSMFMLFCFCPFKTAANGKTKFYLYYDLAFLCHIKKS